MKSTVPQNQEDGVTTNRLIGYRTPSIKHRTGECNVHNATA